MATKLSEIRIPGFDNKLPDKTIIYRKVSEPEYLAMKKGEITVTSIHYYSLIDEERFKKSGELVRPNVEADICEGVSPVSARNGGVELAHHGIYISSWSLKKPKKCKEVIIKSTIGKVLDALKVTNELEYNHGKVIYCSPKEAEGLDYRAAAIFSKPSCAVIDKFKGERYFYSDEAEYRFAFIIKKNGNTLAPCDANITPKLGEKYFEEKYSAKEAKKNVYGLRMANAYSFKLNCSLLVE